VACDFLCSYRNKAFHVGLTFDALAIFRQVSKVALEHSKAWFSIEKSLVVEKWIPPPSSFFKINFDTAIQDTFSAQWVVCRNHRGHIINMETIINPPCQPNMGEALAGKLAFSLAISMNLSQVIIEGDSHIVIMAMQHPALAQDWRISSVINHTIDLIPPQLS
jgi:hypothetical protein